MPMILPCHSASSSGLSPSSNDSALGRPGTMCRSRSTRPPSSSIMNSGARFEIAFTSAINCLSWTTSPMLRPKRTIAYGECSARIRRSSSVRLFPTRPIPSTSVPIVTRSPRAFTTAKLILQSRLQLRQFIQCLQRRQRVELQRAHRIQHILLSGIEQRELPRGPRSIRPRLFDHRPLLPLERRENLACTLDDRLRDTRQLRDLNAVALVRRTGDDLPQEDDLLVPLLHGDIEVRDARTRLREIRDLVIVRGKQRDAAALGVIVQVFDDRPCERQPVERRRAAPDFVEDDERSLRRIVENVRGLVHLDHERRFAARELVRCPDPREDAIEDAETRLRGGDERTRLIENHDERDLAEIGRLPPHVRTGDDLNSIAVPLDVGVIRNEPLRSQLL